MKPPKAILLKSVSSKNDFPPATLPEVVLAGRSNVGKSSLINTYLGQKLAGTSKTPGKTGAINFYLIDDRWFLVDLPGYGYAKVSQQRRKKWGLLIEDFFASTRSIAAILLIVDLRHEPSPLDLQMAAWLRNRAFPSLVVATKADKVPRGKREKQRHLIAQILGTSPQEILLFSSVTGEGRKELIKIIEKKVHQFSSEESLWER